MSAIIKLFADLSEKPFDVQSFVEREAVNTFAFYAFKNELIREMETLFGYYKNSKSLGYYEVDINIIKTYAETMEEFEFNMTKAVIKLLAFDDFEESVSVFKPVTVTDANFKVFYQYARNLVLEHKNDDLDQWVRNLQKTTFLGRFDTSVDPATGRLNGVYEYNSDTPTMFFESMILQNESTIRITDGDYKQQNEMWTMIDDGRYSNLKGKRVGVVVETDYLEDVLSCEGVIQLFEKAGAIVHLADLKQLNHDVLFLDKPFFIDGVQNPIDYIYILLPWEEMMTSMDILSHHERYERNVRFFEPAWRWFMSNKTMMAYITQHLDNEQFAFFNRPDSGFLKTYMDPEEFIKNNQPYVVKPSIGRHSQSVVVVKDGKEQSVIGDEEEQDYGNETKVYQAYCETGSNNNGDRFLVCPWFLTGDFAALAFREFDTEVINWNNERFVPHVLKE